MSGLRRVVVENGRVFFKSSNPHRHFLVTIYKKETNRDDIHILVETSLVVCTYRIIIIALYWWLKKRRAQKALALSCGIENRLKSLSLFMIID